jgi:DNA-binding CsgD family transcriptional regulator
MSAVRSHPAESFQLRVAVHAVDPVRRAVLARLVSQRGHLLVNADVADVVLAEGEHPPGDASRVVMLGGRDNEFSGMLPSDADPRQIDSALRAVAAGLIVRVPPESDAGFGQIAEPDARSLLTPREFEVLDCIAAGLTNKAIARRLDISLHTVKFHIESVFKKLGARTRTEAVANAAMRRRRETIAL